MQQVEPNRPQVLTLTGLRTRGSRTQDDIAAEIGTTQSAVSRIERQHDLLVSTLAEYVAATGGTLRLVAVYEDLEVEIDIPANQAPAERADRDLRVIWQDPGTRQLMHVGTLRVTDSSYRFAYTEAARTSARFEAFPGFPELDRAYRSTELFPFFAARVPSGPRSGPTTVRSLLGLTRTEATPIELLARSGGQSAHDTLQVVPAPTFADGTFRVQFLASGVSHAQQQDPKVERIIARLTPGTELELIDEPTNDFNPKAMIIAYKGHTLGWLPDYMVDDIRKARARSERIELTVEHANGSDAPWHLRLLCHLEATSS